MKKALLTLLLLLIQIANGESVGKTPLTSQSQEQRSVYQNAPELQALESSAATSENEWAEQVKPKSPPSGSETVAKVLGIALLSLAGISAALVIFVYSVGLGGC